MLSRIITKPFFFSTFFTSLSNRYNSSTSLWSSRWSNSTSKITKSKRNTYLKGIIHTCKHGISNYTTVINEQEQHQQRVWKPNDKHKARGTHEDKMEVQGVKTQKQVKDNNNNGIREFRSIEELVKEMNNTESLLFTNRYPKSLTTSFLQLTKHPKSSTLPPQAITTLLKWFIKSSEVNMTILNRLEILYNHSLDLESLDTGEILEILTLLIENKAGDIGLLDRLAQVLVNKVKSSLSQDEKKGNIQENKKTNMMSNMKTLLKGVYLFAKTNYFPSDFHTYIISHLTSNFNHLLKILPHNLLLTLSLFFSLSYEETKSFHPKYYQTLSDLITKDLNYFYSIISKQEYLKYIHTMLLCTKLYDPLDYEQNPSIKMIQKHLPFNYNIPHTTSTQDSIYNLLKRLYPNHTIQSEVLIEIYTIDILIQPNIIIEVNGLGHYVNNQTRRNGYYQIRIRNLKKLGYKILEINNFAWKKLQTDEEKRNILMNLIENAAA